MDGDRVMSLPLDPTQPVIKSDLELLNEILNPKEGFGDGGGGEGGGGNDKRTRFVEVWNEFKPSIVAATLFILLASPIFDSLLSKLTGNTYQHIAIKFFSFLILFYILQNRI